MSEQWSLDEKEKMQKRLDQVETQIEDLRGQKETLLTDLWDLQQP